MCLLVLSTPPWSAGWAGHSVQVQPVNCISGLGSCPRHVWLHRAWMCKYGGLALLEGLSGTTEVRNQAMSRQCASSCCSIVRGEPVKSDWGQPCAVLHLTDGPTPLETSGVPEWLSKSSWEFSSEGREGEGEGWGQLSCDLGTSSILLCVPVNDRGVAYVCSIFTW